MRSRVTVTPFYSLWWIESNCVVHWVEKGEDLRLHTLPPTGVITSRRYQVYSETQARSSQQKLCVKWGTTNTGWHINVHYVNKFLHI